MLRYVMAATALKAFSVNRLSKKLYRQIGNTFGERKRLAVNDIDIRVGRGNLLVDLCRKHQALQDGNRMLEIGTGWMHWYSLYLRLFYDISVTTLDIWDNRQFNALHAAANKLKTVFEQTNTEPKALVNLQKVIRSGGFDDLYRTLGFTYVIEPTGAITRFTDSEFDFITSFHVLEHVPTQYVEQLARDMFRTLKPGAITIHQIGIDDHLTHYDHTASQKQYLKYSDRTWRAFFENEVQYFNRLQTSDWLSLFERAGFRLLDKIVETTNIDALHVDSKFSAYPKEDLECTILTLVHQKPLESSKR
jgi:hypothetical protein